MATSETRVREEVQHSGVEAGIDTGTREHKAAATTAGILYIIGTVAGILSKAVAYFPVHDADDPLAYAAKHSDARDIVGHGMRLIRLATGGAGATTATGRRSRGL